MKEEFNVEYETDRPYHTYQADETINGKFILESLSAFKANTIKAYFVGSIFKKTNSEDSVYEHVLEIINLPIITYYKQQINEGVNIYPFKLLLAQKMNNPMFESFNGSVFSVKYLLCFEIERGFMKDNYRVSFEFSIKAPPNLMDDIFLKPASATFVTTNKKTNAEETITINLPKKYFSNEEGIHGKVEFGSFADTVHKGYVHLKRKERFHISKSQKSDDVYEFKPIEIFDGKFSDDCVVDFMFYIDFVNFASTTENRFFSISSCVMPVYFQVIRFSSKWSFLMVKTRSPTCSMKYPFF